MNFSENFSINKKTNNLPKIFAVAVGLLIFIFILNIFSPVIKNSFYKISSPLEKTFWSAGVTSSGYINSIFNAGDLVNKNDELKNENQKLIAQIVSLQAINNANQAQSDVSTACLNKDFKLLMAEVIGLDGQDILSINKGADDGISEGMPVISQQNVLYGKVIKVYKNYSQVMLLSNKKSVINAKIQQTQPEVAEEPPTEAPATKQIIDTISAAENPPSIAKPVAEIDGVVKGNGNSGIYLDLVPVDSTINQGDFLITSSLEKTFPKDLLIGKIIKVEKNDQKPFQQAEIQSFLNLSSIDNLFVITNYKR